MPGSRYRKKRYRARVKKHTPKWADRRAINALYREAKAMRDRGASVSMDHIVPLSHPLVCGLHVEHNLAIVDARLNGQKSNDYWPDMPGLETAYALNKLKTLQRNLRR